MRFVTFCVEHRAWLPVVALLFFLLILLDCLRIQVRSSCEHAANLGVFIAVVCVLAIVLSLLTGCATRQHIGQWEYYRLQQAEDVECRIVGVDPPWLQCVLPGHRRPTP